MADRQDSPSDVPTGAPDQAYPDGGRDAPATDREQAGQGARRNELDEPEQRPEDVSESASRE